MHEMRPNLSYSKSLRGAAEANFCRAGLDRGSKFQERYILYVSNKIKTFSNFCIGRRISMYHEKIGFLIGLKDSDCQCMAKFDQKIFNEHM